MTRAELMTEIRARLTKAHGRRLKGIVLYGSEARGDAGPDSDIDLLVLLEGPIDLARDLDANLDAVYPLALEVGRRISAIPTDIEEYERVWCPLYENARREGVLV